MAVTMTRGAMSLLCAASLVPVALAGCQGTNPEEEIRALGTNPLGIKEERINKETVCFVTRMLNDTVDIQVTGDLFHLDAFDASTRVILLMSGSTGRRAVWDPGGFLGLARRLARAGYVVVTFDKPGTGESPYPGTGFGFKVTESDNVWMDHQIVEEIQFGKYVISDSTCPNGAPAPFPSPNVIVTAHSVSAAEAIEMAALYPDDNVGGLVLLGAQSAGVAAPNKFLVDFANAQPGVEFPYLFPDRSYCMSAFIYAPGIDAGQAARICDEPTAPRGVLLTAGALRMRNAKTNIATVENVNRIPVLKVWGDEDPLIPPPYWTPPPGYTAPAQVDLGAADDALWESMCIRAPGEAPCDVTTYHQPDASHASMVHYSVAEMADVELNWLAARGLTAHDDGNSVP